MNTELLNGIFKRVADKNIPDGVGSIHGLELESFAKELILECARLITEVFPLDADLSDGYYYPNLGRAQAAAQIKKHFGVD